MKNYIRWLIANTRIRKATFELFWLACYVAGAVASIYFSIVEEWQNIFGLGFVFAMALNQWKRAKAAEVFKVGEIVGYSKRYIEDFDRPPFWAVDTFKILEVHESRVEAERLRDGIKVGLENYQIIKTK